MIVEIEEFKQVNSKDNSKESKPLEKTVTRVLLRPNSETLFADLCLLNQKSGNKWTDKDALEIEAKILVRRTLLFCTMPALTFCARFTACYVSAALLGPGPPPRKDCEHHLSYIPA
jgi:hypothetical protein